MGVFRQMFGFNQNKELAVLLPAIERAISKVEPQLRRTRRYPEAYYKPVKKALEYARSLVHAVPGPVAVTSDAYAKDAYVHAIFPSMERVTEAFRTSRAMQEYLRAHPSADEIYALMGMRRREKTMLGMELSGQIIQRDVPQHMVYFTSHTIESPASSEQQLREQLEWTFFDSLVSKVAKRVELRKQEITMQQQEKDLLMARMRAATTETRPALEAELSGLLSRMQSNTRSLELHNYQKDFEAVLLNPEQHLRLKPVPMILDSMGIRRQSDETEQGVPIVFSDLIGFDRRDWTVTMVYCRDIQSETFAARLETAYRKLCI